jgi:hypothetical protein
MFGLPVFAAAQVDGLLGHFNALLRHEHADNARVRPDRVVEFHKSLPRIFYRQLVDAFEQTAPLFVKPLKRPVASVPAGRDMGELTGAPELKPGPDDFLKFR